MDPAETAGFPRMKRDTKAAACSNMEIEGIYAKYCKRAYAYFLCRTGNPQNAEDMTADLFLKVLCRHKSFDPEKSKFEVWLFRLAKNMAVDFYRANERRAARTVGFEEAREIGEEPSPEQRALESERALALSRAISLLPKKQRSLVALRYAAGMKNIEIAAITGMSEAAAGMALHRALEKLREILNKQGVDLHD